MADAPQSGVVRVSTRFLKWAALLGGALAGIGAIAVATGALALSSRASTLGVTDDSSIRAMTQAGYFFYPDTFRAIAIAVLDSWYGYVLTVVPVGIMLLTLCLPGRWRRNGLAVIGVIVVAVGVHNGVRMSAAFDGINRNILGVPTESAQLSGGDRSPSQYAIEFHRLTRAKEGRTDAVERAYGWCALLMLLTLALYVAFRISALPELSPLRRATLAVTALQFAMLPALYGSLLLTGEPPCVTILDRAPRATDTAANAQVPAAVPTALPRTGSASHSRPTALPDDSPPPKPVYAPPRAANRVPRNMEVRGFLLSKVAEEPQFQLLVRSASGFPALVSIDRATVYGFEFSGGCGQWLLDPVH